MSLLENTFLKVPLENMMALYNDIVIPKLIKKNKSISISIAVVLSLVFFIRERILKPPRKLRHIPYFSYIDSVKSVLSRESVWSRAYKIHLPEINKKESTGLFVELGRPGWVVQVSNSKDAKQVFLKPDLFPKISFASENGENLNSKFMSGPSIVTANGDKWKAQRKVANPAFVKSMPVKLFGKLTQDMFKVMETMGETVNVSDLMERWTLDAIGKAGFGFDFNGIKDRNSEWVVRYDKINLGLRDPKFFFFPIFDAKLRWLFPERVKLHKEMDIFLGMLDDMIKTKRDIITKGLQETNLEDNEKDLVHLLIESEMSGEGIMNNEELKSNLCIFFLAGHDTTASALAFAIHYLAENQDMQKKAREEAIRILGDEPHDVLPTVQETKKMTYINQIMKETLRINPAAPRTITRFANEDTELSGTFIPKGTQLVVNIFNIQHSEKIWKDGDKFDPERFAEGGEASHVESMGWTPFGNGVRQCIGMNFSLSEQRVMLSMLLRKFTWETPENSIHKNGVITFGAGVISPHNLDITFHKRY